MISLRKVLDSLNIDFVQFVNWVDEGIKLSNINPNFDPQLGPVVSEVELVVSNFAKGNVSIHSLTENVLHSLVVSISALQALKFSVHMMAIANGTDSKAMTYSNSATQSATQQELPFAYSDSPNKQRLVPR